MARAAGFYRVAYPLENWRPWPRAQPPGWVETGMAPGPNRIVPAYRARCLQKAFSGLPAPDHSQLIDDAFALSWARELDPGVALDLSEGVAKPSPCTRRSMIQPGLAQ